MRCAAGGYLVATDKDLNETHDVFPCLDADSGRQLWKLSYPAAGEVDFTNSARANPVAGRPRLGRRGKL
ncbi:MAG: hypothetical protein JXB62_04235 [Pirellulales bacterium]|nr:hypothetical protein [Pirellulales bacterium]